MDRFLIAPFETGLQLNLRPWLIMDDAFEQLKNAYIWRGKVRKRFGAKYTGYGAPTAAEIPLYSRLAIPLAAPITAGAAVGVGITDAGGNATNPANVLVWPEFKIGQYFTIGAFTYTITVLGAPAVLTPSAGAPATIHTFNTTTGVYNFTTAGAGLQVYFYPNGSNLTSGAGQATGVVPGTAYNVGQLISIGSDTFTVISNTPGFQNMLRSDGLLANAQFNITTGEFNILDVAHPNTQVYFYPAEPVMGITQYNVGAINDHPSYVFDTQFIYLYNNRWTQADPTIIFHGNDTQFFWGANYIEETTGSKALFVTNFNATLGAGPFPNDDPIYYLVGAVWTAFNPVVIPGPPVFTVVQARIIVNFKGRLIFLNTIERETPAVGVATNRAYPNRCRFSKYGGNATSVNSFVEPQQVGYEGGGYIDAPTDQSIISAQFIKDRLIVYFERSTYELAYIGNQLLPFVWQKLNTELGSQSTFSTVPFDTEVLTCGNTGFHTCNGSNVARIDFKIPDFVFDQINSDLTNTNRICSIRDYFSETVYWSFRDNGSMPTADYPGKILLYNYRNQTWALIDEQVTAFGYFEQITGISWAAYTMPWYSWTASWGSGVDDPGFRQVIAGNQEGFIFVIDRDNPICAAVIQISNIVYTGVGPYTATITAVNHNLYPGAHIKIEDLTLTLPLAFRNKIYEVETIVDENSFTIATTTNPAYTGNAYYRFISPINIKSKQWNPYMQQARDVYVAKIDFGVEATTEGAITVDYYASSQDDSTLYNAAVTGTLLGTGSLSTAPYPTIPQEINANRLWHPLYFQNEGECIQIELSYSEDQIIDVDIVDSDFVLEGIVLHCTPTTSRLY